MPKAYSMDLRARVISAVDAGESLVSVARRYEVSKRWIGKLLRQRRETGSIVSLPRRGGRKPKLAEHYERLRGLVAARPDATLHELREKLPVRVSITALWSALRGLGLAFKKSSVRGRATAA